jgi:hypothetical protein
MIAIFGLVPGPPQPPFVAIVVFAIFVGWSDLIDRISSHAKDKTQKVAIVTLLAVSLPIAFSLLKRLF